MLLKRKIVSNDTQLYTDLKESLKNYSEALKHYYRHVDEDMDGASPYAQMLMQQVEVYRQQYFKLRLEYEFHHGNPAQYYLNVFHFFKWGKENNIRCLFQQPQDKYTTVSSLDNVRLIED